MKALEALATKSTNCKKYETINIINGIAFVLDYTFPSDRQEERVYTIQGKKITVSRVHNNTAVYPVTANTYLADVEAVQAAGVCVYVIKNQAATKLAKLMSEATYETVAKDKERIFARIADRTNWPQVAKDALVKELNATIEIFNPCAF